MLKLHLNPVLLLHMQSPTPEIQVHLEHVIKQPVCISHFSLPSFSNQFQDIPGKPGPGSDPHQSSRHGVPAKEELAFECHRVVTSAYTT